MSSSKPSSRFSSLKVFKFSGKSGSSSQLPPPLPPKDPIYLSSNRSLASLVTTSASTTSPDSLSLAPVSPLTPEWHGRDPYLFAQQRPRRGPSPSPSANGASYLQANGDATSSSAASVRSVASRKASSFFRLGKKSPGAASASSPAGSPMESLGDTGISTPFNIQHNMHVDEGFTGLPPSWTTRLREVGYSTEELTALNARRRLHSPSSTSLVSSKSAHHRTGPNGSPVIANPAPRNASLPRQPSLSSVSASSTSTSPPAWHNQPRPPYAHHNPLPSSASTHSSTSSDAQYVYVGGRPAPALPIHTSSSRGGTPPPSQAPVTSTPPRRQFRIVNESPPSGSPPPAYSGPSRSFSNFQADHKPSSSNAPPHPSHPPPPPPLEDAGSPSRQDAQSQRTHRQNASLSSGISGISESTARSLRTDEGNTADMSPHRTADTSVESLASSQGSGPGSSPSLPRLAIPPPRLSLGAGGELDNWSDQLFSALPTLERDANGAPGHKTTFESSATSLPSTVGTNGRSPSNQDSQRSRPLRSQFEADDDEDEDDDLALDPELVQPGTPLWEELIGLVRPPSQTSHRGSPRALDLDSPTLPGEKVTRPKVQVATSPLGRASNMSTGDNDNDNSNHISNRDTLLPSNRDTLMPSNRDTLMPSSRDRDSAMSTASTSTVTAATVATVVSIGRIQKANIVDPRRSSVASSLTSLTNRSPMEVSKMLPSLADRSTSTSSAPDEDANKDQDDSPNSPRSSYSSPSDSGSDDSASPFGSDDSSRPTTRQEADSSPSISPTKPQTPALLAYLSHSRSPSPSPTSSTFKIDPAPPPPPLKPITIRSPASLQPQQSQSPISPSAISPQSPLHLAPPSPSPAILVSAPPSPVRRYRGWQSEAIAPIEQWVDYRVDPRERFESLTEIAEGESGSVYAARRLVPGKGAISSGSDGKVQDADEKNQVVAIKSVALLPSGGSQKLLDLKTELSITRGCEPHEHILGMDELYVDLIDDSLWIVMELMERSLADVVALVEEGLMLQERMIARFARDLLLALDYLQDKGIAHRDVRSDNLLLNSDGVLKLVDFSNAVQLTPHERTRTDVVGVIYWQAPEMRKGPYDPTKVDVWSTGATVWEMAQAEPPFANTEPRKIGASLPPLKQPELYSRAFHEFLRICSLPAVSRPSPATLIETPFIDNACGRAVIVQLLMQCKAIEEHLAQREGGES